MNVEKITLGPFGIIPTQLKLTLHFDGGMYQVALAGPLASLALPSGVIAEFGSLSPINPLTLDEQSKRKAKIPSNATAFVWAYPLVGISELTEVLDLSTPELIFASFGGFVYLDEQLCVVGANAIGLGNDLFFSGPHTLPPHLLTHLEADGRFQSVTIANLRARGAREYCWIGPGEKLQGVAIATNGAFAYLQADKTCIYFPVAAAPVPNGDIDQNNSEDGTKSFLIATHTPVKNELEKNVPEGNEDNLQRRLLCKVCKKILAEVVMIPCGHLGMCTKCAQEIMSCGNKKCVVCGALFTTIQSVYY